MKVQIKILNKEFYNNNNLLPGYQTQGSAAIDLYCTEDITVYPGDVKQIKTGIAVWIGSSGGSSNHIVFSKDVSVAGMILPRSGLGSKGLVLANTVGVIDEDYQGELLVNVWNRTEGTLHQLAHSIDLVAGDRFAQLLFMPVIKAEWQIVDEFSNKTNRGEDGFGSTGV